MKNTLLLFITILLFSCKSADKPENIKQAFEKYRLAILAGKGEEAVTLLDSTTIAYYSNILDISKKSDSLQIDSLNVLYKFTVLAVKHITPKEKLLSMDAEELIIFSIKEG